MPCLVVLLALFVPRVVLVLIWLFGGGYLARAFHTVLWPLAGFIFMPLTTLVYAFAMNSNQGHVSGIYTVLLVLAVLIDLGIIGGSGAGRRRRSV